MGLRSAELVAAIAGRACRIRTAEAFPGAGFRSDAYTSRFERGRLALDAGFAPTAGCRNTEDRERPPGPRDSATPICEMRHPSLSQHE